MIEYVLVWFYIYSYNGCGFTGQATFGSKALCEQAAKDLSAASPSPPDRKIVALCFQKNP